jgi:hypothetical protein
LWSPFKAKLRETFGRRCGFLAMWVPSGTLDHWISIHTDRALAYEWENYRFVDGAVNSAKKPAWEGQLIDPFEVEEGWFELLLPSLQLVASETGPGRNSGVKAQIVRQLGSEGLAKPPHELVGGPVRGRSGQRGSREGSGGRPDRGASADSRFFDGRDRSIGSAARTMGTAVQFASAGSRSIGARNRSIAAIERPTTNTDRATASGGKPISALNCSEVAPCEAHRTSLSATDYGRHVHMTV